MAGRISSAMERALEHVEQYNNVSEAARVHGLDVRSVRRALRRAEVPPAGGPTPAMLSALALQGATGRTTEAAKACGVKVASLRAAMRRARLKVSAPPA